MLSREVHSKVEYADKCPECKKLLVEVSDIENRIRQLKSHQDKLEALSTYEQKKIAAKLAAQRIETSQFEALVNSGKLNRR